MGKAVQVLLLINSPATVPMGFGVWQWLGAYGHMRSKFLINLIYYKKFGDQIPTSTMDLFIIFIPIIIN